MARVSAALFFFAFLCSACDPVRKSADFLFNRYRITSPSMSPTLEVGESFSVSARSSFGVNEIVVFRPPSPLRYDNESVVWVSRLVGIPGDTLEMKQGVLYRNGEKFSAAALMHSYTLKSSMPLNNKWLEGIDYQLVADNEYFLFLSDAQVARLRKNKAVQSIKRNIIGPTEKESNTFLQNRDNWGPMRIPRSGDRLHEVSDYYAQTFEEHEEWQKDSTSPYIVKNDYYFIMGDNRHNSLDSRYIGMIPHSDLVGVMNVD